MSSHHGFWVRIVACILLISAASSGHAVAATLIDKQLLSGLQAGRAQRVIVQFKDTPGASIETGDQQRQRRQLLKSRVLDALTPAHVKDRRDFSELPSSSMTLLNPAALSRLLADPQVDAVYPDKLLHAHLAQSLPLIGQTAVSTIMGRQGAGVGIAVLDTGVDYTRAELGACTAPGQPAATCKVVATFEAAANDAALDASGHGTEVALVAVATAPQAKIIAVDVFNGNAAFTSDTLSGINWVINNRSTYNIGIINLSLGDGIEHTSACGNTDPFYSSVNSARNAGLIVVASSGNEGYANGVSSPACVSSAIAVGAVYDASVGNAGWNVTKYNTTTGTTSTTTCWDNPTAADMVTCFSDSSAQLDLLAPGANITLGNGQVVSGTSFAAPFVSGAAAVLRAQFPSETVSQIEARLINNGPSITDPRNGIIKRRLDLLAAQGPPSNDNFSAATALTGASGSVAAWNYNATAQAGEPAHAGQVASHSVWWTWTAPASGTLSLSTQGSNQDTVLAVYTGTSVSALSAVASNDDKGSGVTSSALSLGVVGGQVYRIAVDGKGGATGSVPLAWSYVNTPYNIDLSVILSSAVNAASVGDTVVVQAVIHNAGPQTTADANVAWTLPSGLSLLATPDGCTVVDANTLNCALPSLAPTAQTTLSLQLGAVGVGSQAVVASVGTSIPDTPSANNQSTLNITVQQAVANGGGPNGSGDVPLPPWVLGLLASALWGFQQCRRQAQA